MKSRSYRLVSFLSPEIEDLLITNNITSELVLFFKNLIEFCNKTKYVIFFVIPNTIEFAFNFNKELKMIKESIIYSSQSNVLFIPLDKKLPCAINAGQISQVIPSEHISDSSKNLIISYIHSRKYPLLLDISKSSVSKIRCHTCDPSEYICSDEFNIDIATIPTEETLEALADIAETSISLWHINRKNVSCSDIKSLSYLNGILYGLNYEALECINKYDIHEELLCDLKDNHDSNFSNVAFSMLRAIAYPPSSSTDRHKYSIDLHRNNPYKIKEYDFNLFRVDVMPPTKSGVSSSGVERLLLAQKGDRFTFVCYTCEHDFVLPTIKNRLSCIN